MTREEARKAAEVMLAYADGAEIEVCDNEGLRIWDAHAECGPGFNWSDYKYRVKVTKPSIDWSHVSDELVCLMESPSGYIFLSTHVPEASPSNWVLPDRARTFSPDSFASFKPGTCDWKESLVIRPGYEESEAV